MPLSEIIVLAVCLSLDAFAVALAAGASGRAQGGRAEFRISFHFGLFQFAMPIIGWIAANSIREYIESIDHWLACGLLWFVGIRMIAAREDDEVRRERNGDPSKGMSLVALSVATSIDALAIGVSLAFLGTQIIWPSCVIGLTTASFSLAGMRLGGTLSGRYGDWMTRIGGAVLLVIGARIVYVHLYG
ncbi:MAG TPA: manganese efflux pump MntP family protein [Bacteroidota bacterium]|nr:manganese efflux pump MntP family protein [Bacteroidota bacterium]